MAPIDEAFNLNKDLVSPEESHRDFVGLFSGALAKEQALVSTTDVILNEIWHTLNTELDR